MHVQMFAAANLLRQLRTCFPCSAPLQCAQTLVLALLLWPRCLSPLNSKFISSFNVNQLTPLHAVTLLRPGLDVVVLPNRPDVREFFRFVKATTGLDDNQVSWSVCYKVPSAALGAVLFSTRCGILYLQMQPQH